VTIAAIRLGEALAISIATPLGIRITIAVASDRATIFAGTSDVIGAAAKFFGSHFRHQYSRGALIWRSRANAAMDWPLCRHSSSTRRASSSVQHALSTTQFITAFTAPVQ
jgi:hypothetical protein